MDFESAPLDKAEAVKLALKIVLGETVTYSTHALDEMDKDNMTDTDVRNVLRAGTMPNEAELVKGSYRYRMVTRKFAVVFVFRSETELKIVTAWRF